MLGECFVLEGTWVNMPSENNAKTDTPRDRQTYKKTNRQAVRKKEKKKKKHTHIQTTKGTESRTESTDVQTDRQTDKEDFRCQVKHQGIFYFLLVLVFWCLLTDV